MLVAHDELYEVVSSIWQTVLGFGVSPRPGIDLPQQKEDFLTGCVQLTGSWSGAIILVCSGALARQAAGAVFCVDAHEVTTDLMHDVVGELANTVAGNLKALLPGTCFLGLPVVAEGADSALRVLASRPLVEIGLTCRELPFGVMILERDAGRAGSSTAKAQPRRANEEFA